MKESKMERRSHKTENVKPRASHAGPRLGLRVCVPWPAEALTKRHRLKRPKNKLCRKNIWPCREMFVFLHPLLQQKGSIAQLV